MSNKIIGILIIILLLIAALIAGYNLGHRDGRKVTWQKCIDKVSENCEYICGVGADFYYPDKQDPPASSDEYELVDDSLVARKGGYARYTQAR